MSELELLRNQLAFWDSMMSILSHNAIKNFNRMGRVYRIWKVIKEQIEMLEKEQGNEDSDHYWTQAEQAEWIQRRSRR